MRTTCLQILCVSVVPLDVTPRQSSNEEVLNRSPVMATRCHYHGDGAWVCTVSLSLFAGPERILRRFSVFAEEPCKSTITTTEPCSPVFKEAQPRPSTSQSRREKHSVEFKSLIVVHNVFLLLVICCCNKASNRIVPKTKGISVFWIPLSPEVSRLSPYTHTHINIHELQEPSEYSLYTGGYTP